jgi:hypothetical protein
MCGWFLQVYMTVCALFHFCSGDAARKAAAASAEAAAQQQAVMAAVEAETKQEVVVETSAVSQVIPIHSVLLHD